MSQNATCTRPDDVDARIVEAAFNGDNRAFEQIVVRYEQPIYHLCVRYVGEGADAEDAAQDAFVKAFMHREKFDVNRPLLPWLMTIARRLCIDRLRRQKRANIVPAVDTDTMQSDERDADERIHEKKMLEILASSLEALPEGQRETVVLYHVDGLAYKEIAGVLDVPVGTVMTWLHRGRAKLQKWYYERTATGLRAATQGE